MRIDKFLLSCVAATVCLGFLYSAQSQSEQPPQSHSRKFFRSDTIETISGKVAKIKEIPHYSGKGYAIQLDLKTNNEVIAVNVGPNWFLEEKGIQIHPSDFLEITGSRVTVHGKTSIIATKIKKEDRQIILRDKNGVSMWRRIED